jgi:hypothetical protein
MLHKKVKVKCTLVQAMRLCTGHMAQRGSRGIALPFFTTALKGGEGSASHPSHSLPIVQEVGWAPGPVWTGAENLAPTGIGSPDRPARSQSLYRLNYPTERPIKDCLFNIFAATLHIAGRSSIRNLRTRHAVVTGTHLSRFCTDSSR